MFVGQHVIQVGKHVRTYGVQPVCYTQKRTLSKFGLYSPLDLRIGFDIHATRGFILS